MKKNAYFFIDDVIWPFRDIAREGYKSIFEQRWLKMLKEAHDKYGLKVTLNCFYRTAYAYGDDEFSLADMPDTYKKEWEDNADWLKLGYHAKEEFPDFPLLNVTYKDMKNQYERFVKEVKRFAGEGSLMRSMNVHWWTMSKEGCEALRDCGIKLISCTVGYKKPYDESIDLPFGHGFRVTQGQTPHAGVRFKDKECTEVISPASYNHLEQDEVDEILHNLKKVYREDAGIYLKRFGGDCGLNGTPLDQIEEKLMGVKDAEFISPATHEQYAYPDYCWYQPDTYDKLMKMCQVVTDNGFEFMFIDDCLDM